MIQTLSVRPQGGQAYNILIDNSLNYRHLLELVNNRQVLVVTNDVVAPHYLDQLIQVVSSITTMCHSVVLPDGEIHKSAQSLDLIYTQLIERRYHRKAVIIALGGGVIGDIAGYAAATYQRGVSVIQVPTTLLSQVDSSVGGKTAINHPLGKNLIGAFYQPQFVYSSTAFYQTLPDREYRSGLAEVIKYACLGDRYFFEQLEAKADAINAKDPQTLIWVIRHCCEMKANIVAQDAFEQNDVRALLNLGHTFGHAIEQCQQYQGLRHGEAVGVGMVLAARFSCQLGLIGADVVMRIELLLAQLKIPTQIPEGIDYTAFIDAMLRDKKNDHDKIVFILFKGLGDAFVAKDIDRNEVENFLADYFDALS